MSDFNFTDLEAGDVLYDTGTNSIFILLENIEETSDIEQSVYCHWFVLKSGLKHFPAGVDEKHYRFDALLWTHLIKTNAIVVIRAE